MGSISFRIYTGNVPVPVAGSKMCTPSSEIDLPKCFFIPVSDKVVIDNETVILKDEVRDYLEDTTQASIAVGYFYISGFAEIMDSLKRIEESDDPDHLMRLLISPNSTNRQTAEAMLASNEAYETAKRQCQSPYPDEKSTDAQREEFRKTLEHMPQSDKEALAIRKFIDLINKKKVQVKVYTKEKLHAKAYIFELDNKHRTRVAIVGSSNLSISGIKQHTELNLVASNPNDALLVREWFERHWNDDSCKAFTEEYLAMLDESWAGKEKTPEDIYRKAILHEHKDRFDEYMSREIESGTKDIELFNFQKKAVGDAINKLDRFGGVIIADVVGMGKTYMGGAILKYLKDNGYQTPLVICPSHLQDMWLDTLKKFGIPGGRVLSKDKISHSPDVLAEYEYCNAILIDESHNFRNSGTNGYDAMLAFMEGKPDAKIVMLSATPISNGIIDLKNQLRLFPRDGLETLPPLINVGLDNYFKGINNNTPISEYYEKVRDLLRHILIRRTRSQVLDIYAKSDGNRMYLEQADGRKYFPERNLRNPEEYNADKVYNDAYESIEAAIRNLHLARYAPGKYLTDEIREEIEKGNRKYQKYEDLHNTTKPLTGIVRTSLLKRMESSIKAFDSSIKNYVTGYRVFRKQILKGRVPIGKDFGDSIYKWVSESGDYDDQAVDAKIEAELEAQLEATLEKIPAQYEIGAFDADMWIREIDEDLSRFAEIQGHLQPSTTAAFEARDDKLHKLADLVSEYDGKTLIFTESAVTAKYIHGYLKNRFPDKKMGQIDSRQNVKKKNEMVWRFDPVHNPRKETPDELDILISTDVLSEGVNLHAGRVVINYDFHWNPVRLIQRVGRIDRIGSEHLTIDIYNFLPTTKIDKTLSLKGSVANKIQTIRKIMGHDQQILESTETIDEDSVIAIYNPDKKTTDKLLDAKVGLLDLEDLESERDADIIRSNDDLFELYKSMQYGLRSSAGRGKLLIACEAEETLTGISGTDKNQFVKHYEIAGGMAKEITDTSFLRQMGSHKNKRAPFPDDYGEYVKVAWSRFSRDIKDATAKNRMLRHQAYFEKELRRMMVDPQWRSAAIGLLPFVTARMRGGTTQPYRGLAELRKEIDADPEANDAVTIRGLEKLMSKYKEISYTSQISKPRILYSMMVDA